MNNEQCPMNNEVEHEELGAATVGHVADSCHRYPGEVITFFTRVEVRDPSSDLTLRVSLPEGLAPGDCRVSPTPLWGGATPVVEVDGRTHTLVWSLDGELAAGTRYEYRVEARVPPTDRDVNLESRAVLTAENLGTLAEETATVAVRATGKYLRYLPEIYEQDELMNRLLMFLESFWAPIETQIGSMHCYFDPDLASAGFLSYLASWLGLALDERLPEERQRQLLQSAVSLYRRRGTKQGLQDHLEIYTGGQAHITEYRAYDFCLGPEARLGPGIALGTQNVPYTFAVTLHLPPVEGEDADEVARKEDGRRRMIERIIEAEKPAHTACALELRMVDGGCAMEA